MFLIVRGKILIWMEVACIYQKKEFELYIHYISSSLTHLLMCVCVCVFESLSCVWLFATPWTVAHQAPLPMEFSRQEYWSGLPFPPPGDLPNSGIKPGSPALQVDFFLSSEPLGKPLTGIFSSQKDNIV